MRLLWEDRAWEDYCYWQEHDRKILRRINTLLKDIQRSGYEGIGKPEPLRGNLSKYWSRHIDDKNRIIYYINADTAFILSCKGHYDDK